MTDLKAEVDELRRRINNISTAVLRKDVDNMWSTIYPVGSIYISVVATNPNTLFGGGTWVAFGTGRVLVGVDTGQAEFDVVEETGGAKTHTLTLAEMPAHFHNIKERGDGSGVFNALFSNTGGHAGGFIASESTGGGGAHNNLQPYVVVHMWKRTA